MQGWFLAGDNPQNYEVGAMRDVIRSDKPSGYLRFKGGSETAGFGTLMQIFRAEKYLNKRVRFSGHVKAGSVVQKAGLWMRVDGPVPEKYLSFDNMDDRPIQGTRDWHPYSVILDVPPESTNIALGILLTGPGEVWLTELAFEEVGKDVSVTGATRLPPTEPQNLSFEVE